MRLRVHRMNHSAKFVSSRITSKDFFKTLVHYRSIYTGDFLCNFCRTWVATPILARVNQRRFQYDSIIISRWYHQRLRTYDENNTILVYYTCVHNLFILSGFIEILAIIHSNRTETAAGCTTSKFAVEIGTEIKIKTRRCKWTLPLTKVLV